MCKRLTYRQLQQQSDNRRIYQQTMPWNAQDGLSLLKKKSLTEDAFFYWQNENDSVEMIGIGATLLLQSGAEEERFHEIESSVRLLRQRAEDDFLLFGSFTFDAAHEPSPEWNAYENALFIVPTYCIRRDGDVWSKTITVYCEPEEKDELLNQRVEQWEQLQREKEENAKFVTYTKLEERQVEQYRESIPQMTSLIREGKAHKVVLARSLRLQFEQHPQIASLMEQLNEQQKNSYRFAFHIDDSTFIGATPERLIKVNHRQANSESIAGSIRRGNTAEEDKKLGESLLADEKNREEHHYVVEMIEPIFQELCETYTMPDRPQLLKMRDIQHLHTPIQGEMKDDVTILQFIERLHPTPALGGVPTKVSLEYIRQFERQDRGLYAAPIGWFDTEGNGEFAVAIRSALLKDNAAYLYAGGGIVADSNVEHEYQETWNKFSPMLRIFGGARENDE